MQETPIAGNGLLSRRLYLRLAAAGAGSAVLLPAIANEPWERGSGQPPSGYGEPSRFARLTRERVGGHPFGPAAGSSSTPLQHLNGVLTPNSLHFERHHSGIPDIDPVRHRLTVHGRVRRPLRFSHESLLRYPLTSRVMFLECSGNSYQNTGAEAPDLTAGQLSGLLSCAEWTGVPLSLLLEEAGMLADAASGWLVAVGADASGNNRSLPLPIALGDAMVALYQNGEPLRPAQGYPMRLFVPGCEGNVSIKWLKALEVRDQPAHTREETSKYTDLLPDGSARQFTLRMEVKSIITSPSGRMRLPERGVYEISGLAWSGSGAIRRVEVSADGGRSWTDADLQTEAAALRPVRFRIPWRYAGAPALLMSRATDDTGAVQPSRDAALAGQSVQTFYHYNGIQSWRVDEQGRVSNAFA
ncbi:MAG: sulfite dehydrogenase [Pseudomonadota bacterium]